MPCQMEKMTILANSVISWPKHKNPTKYNISKICGAALSENRRDRSDPYSLFRWFMLFI